MKKIVGRMGLGIAAVALCGAAWMASASADTATETPAPVELEKEAAAFSLNVSNAKAKVGEAGAITVTVTAGEGFKCNEEYPHKIKKIKGEGVKVPDSVRGDRSKSKITFSIPVTPTSAGDHAVTGEIRFSVCNDTACHIKKLPLNATVTGE